MITEPKPGTPEQVLKHFGVKGMHWGVRKETSSGSSKSSGPSRLKRVGKALGKAADNTLFEVSANTNANQNQIASKAIKKMQADLPGIKSKHGAYGKLRNRVRHPFSPEAKAYRKDIKETYLKHLESSANEITNIRGTRQYTLAESGKPNTSQYFWRVETKSVGHAASDVIKVRPIFDSEGWIVDFEVIDDSLEQAADFVNNVLSHSGTEKLA